MAGSLLVIAVALVARLDRNPRSGQAFAQTAGVVGARGVFAFSGQFSKGTYGVYMVDADAMTIWAYEYVPQSGNLKLAAARTWRYDRYLESYNAGGPAPEDVERMVEDQRRYRLQSSKDAMP